MEDRQLTASGLPVMQRYENKKKKIYFHTIKCLQQSLTLEGCGQKKKLKQQGKRTQRISLFVI